MLSDYVLKQLVSGGADILAQAVWLQSPHVEPVYHTAPQELPQPLAPKATKLDEAFGPEDQVPLG